MEHVTVTELHTQDGWDWPNGVSDERWPVLEFGVVNAQADARILGKGACGQPKLVRIEKP